jgi:hypothetical protein
MGFNLLFACFCANILECKNFNICYPCASNILLIFVELFTKIKIFFMKHAIALFKVLALWAIYLSFSLSNLQAQDPASCGSLTQPTLCSKFDAIEPNYTFSVPTSTSSLISGSFINQNILIESNFTINTSVLFQNCKIKFGQNGKITIINGGGA